MVLGPEHTETFLFTVLKGIENNQLIVCRRVVRLTYQLAVTFGKSITVEQQLHEQQLHEQQLQSKNRL